MTEMMSKCPSCGAMVEDVDCVGVVFHDPKQGGCNYCAHVSVSGTLDGAGQLIEQCDFCGERWSS